MDDFFVNWTRLIKDEAYTKYAHFTYVINESI